MYFCHISMLSVRRFCLNKLTILSFFLFISSHINAQIDIKSKVDAQTYASYSKAIDLFQTNINSNSIITLFVPSNEGLERFNPQILDAVFMNRNNYEIINFINNHSINEFKNTDDFINSISNNSSIVIKNKANSNLIFSKNPPYVMITDLTGYESNILSSISINSKISLHFISSAIKY
jgi:hypothetical protein